MRGKKSNRNTNTTKRIKEVSKVEKNKKSKNQSSKKIAKGVKKKSLKKLKTMVVCMVVVLLTSISLLSKTLNPFVTIRGIILMQRSTTGVVKLSDEPLKYICKSYYELISLLQADGYVVIQRDNRLIEAMKNGKPHFLKSTDFLGIYEIFNEL